MVHLIDKDALVAEIKKRINFNETLNAHSRLDECNAILSFLDTLEVKEVDLEEYYHKFLQEEWFGNSHVRTVSEMMAFTAKHFFELGLKAQHSSIGIPNIDNIFEEEGIDPNSKNAKIFKECYYTALEKLKVQKGE